MPCSSIYIYIYWVLTKKVAKKIKARTAMFPTLGFLATTMIAYSCWRRTNPSVVSWQLADPALTLADHNPQADKTLVRRRRPAHHTPAPFLCLFPSPLAACPAERRRPTC